MAAPMMTHVFPVFPLFLRLSLLGPRLGPRHFALVLLAPLATSLVLAIAPVHGVLVLHELVIERAPLRGSRRSSPWSREHRFVVPGMMPARVPPGKRNVFASAYSPDASITAYP